MLPLLLIAGLCLAEAKKSKAKQEKDAGGWSQKTNEQGKVVQELKIEAPSMTEEDQYGHKMPDRYKCDSCRAVMFHLDAGLKKVHPKSRRMKQWEYTDAFDEACRGSFEGYGIKLLNGENTLSGPGLTHTETALNPGSGAIQMGGETWSKRLSEACRSIIYERVGEDELYDKYREDGGLTEAVCYRDLRDCQTGPKTPPKPKEEPEVEKPKPKKEKKKKKLAAEKPQKAAKKPAVVETTDDSSKAEVDLAEVVDSQTFLRRMALRNGLSAEEYLTARTEREWEKLMIAMAGRLFSKHSEL